jgi:hypothetical protein
MQAWDGGEVGLHTNTLRSFVTNVPLVGIDTWGSRCRAGRAPSYAAKKCVARGFDCLPLRNQEKVRQVNQFQLGGVLKFYCGGIRLGVKKSLCMFVIFRKSFRVLGQNGYNLERQSLR